MALPPQYACDIKSVFIHMNDPAWDFDRIHKEEKAEWKKNKTFIHHVWKYMAGQTRYDITANGVHEYIDETKRPHKYLFRRLTILEMEGCRALLTGEVTDAAYREAFRLGLDDIQNLDELDIKEIDRPGERLPMKTLERLKVLVGEQYMYDVGAAIIRASSDLVDTEKKA